jgi:hypothetical protein
MFLSPENCQEEETGSGTHVASKAPTKPDVFTLRDKTSYRVSILQ